MHHDYIGDNNHTHVRRKIRTEKKINNEKANRRDHDRANSGIGNWGVGVLHDNHHYVEWTGRYVYDML